MCGEALEDLTTELVRQARAEGLSWQRIGELFGTSRQAVHQRFARRVDDDDDYDDGGSLVPARV
jgi:DNA-directed RNA polymerase specialized sigma24 family protein